MIGHSESARVLMAAFLLLREGQPLNLFTICGEADMDAYRALRALSRLHQLGLMDRRTLGPTLAGVAVAAGLCAELEVEPRLRRATDPWPRGFASRRAGAECLQRRANGGADAA